MSTVAQLINRTQRQLLSGIVEQRNKLSSTITASGTSVTVDYALDSLRVGQTFEIEAELFYIWAADTTTRALTVERGWNGTTAAAHTAGAILTVNPRFPRNQIFEAFNDDLYDLAAPLNGLYRVKTLDIAYNGNDTMLNLNGASNIIDLLDVRLRYISTDYPLVRKVSLVRNVPTSDFSSGYALKFNESTMAGSLRVTYKTGFNPMALEANDVQTITGFPLSAEDILVLGAQIRLMAPREIKRNFTESQGDTRRADEVPAGSVTNSIANLQKLRRDRIIAEATKLDSQYPIVLSKI